MLDLWWQITEQTYLYYWHQRIWAVLAVWAIVGLLIILCVLIGEELWKAGYRAAMRSGTATKVSFGEQPPVAPTRPSAERRRFLAPPSQAFPGVRRLFSVKDESDRSLEEHET